MTIDELTKKLPIDIRELHKVAEGQPELMYAAGELAANAKAAAKSTKMGYETAKATADRAIRDNPSAFGLAKATEKSIESTVILVKEVNVLCQAAIDAEYFADKATALVQAFAHRKSMIQDEVTLYVNNYWGEITEKSMDVASASASARKSKDSEKKLIKGRKDVAD